ncbi:MAG TPA: ATP-binding protein [Aquabacterium sp.]|nr:ATP-binding protein [Aquabacterium sp.]
MKQRSLRVLLPLLLLLMLVAVGATSLAYTLHKRQARLTDESRVTLLGDVARLARLAHLAGEEVRTRMATDLAQIASRPQVSGVLLFTDQGEVLMAHRSDWRGRSIHDVWPQLEVGRVKLAVKGLLPDLVVSADGNHMDALQAFDLPSGDDEVRSSRRGLAYVAYDLTTSRQLARYDEIMGRVPDMVGLLLLLAALVWLLGRHVTRPLAQLAQVASALRAGRWDVDIPQGGFQEIDRLGVGFDALRQELAATWRAMPDLLFELDRHGKYLRVVASRPELLVIAPDQLLGRTLHEVMPVATADALMQALRDAEAQNGVWGREVMLDVPAGTRWFEISVAPKHAVDAAEPTFLVVSRDVTSRREAQTRLHQLNDELERRVAARTAELLAAKNEAERANQSKSEFLSRMSHELRTPLNAILGFGQLLEMSLRDPGQQAQAHQIILGGKHLLALINEVLDLARVESGQMTVSLERVGVQALVRECLDLVRPQALAAGIQVHDAQCDPDVQVMADRIRCKQVLLNLLSNAIKYNRPGGEVWVRCASRHQKVAIEVADSGEGLSPEQQARLFVPFERLGADERQIEGTGIGLALSKRLVSLMGGEIEVLSRPGLGSTFSVLLYPARTEGRVEALTLPHAPQLVDPIGTDPEAKQSRTVLCIEDNPNNLQLIESILGLLPDVRMLSAIAPGLGLELARTHQPDLILLDINLPDMDGFAVMRCLSESPATRHIPVVAVSANAMPQDLERGRAAGFVDYITKPIDVGRLLRVVDGLVGKREPEAPLDWSI